MQFGSIFFQTVEPLAIMSVCSALNIVNLCIFLLCVWLFGYFVCVDMDPPGSEIKNYIYNGR